MSKYSTIGEKIVGSQIIKLNNLIKSITDKRVYNYTIGDFDPTIHQIPGLLSENIVSQYELDNTNYPHSQGELALRESISKHTKRNGAGYEPDEILVGAGVRPLIYTMFRTILDVGDYVLFPVPSWNNDHYSFLSYCNTIPIETKPENKFNLTPFDVEYNIHKCNLICLCSPQNPTGTVMDKLSLGKICEIILNKNKELGCHKKPVYLFLDEIYSELIDDKYNILNDYPDMKEYIISVDGISKSFCATGVRVGWMMGSKSFISQATQIFSHIGAWSPKPEQRATAKYINNTFDYNSFIDIKKSIYKRIMKGFISILDKHKDAGFEYVKPDGGIYLSVKIPYRKTTTDLNYFLSYLVNDCGIGLVPFDYFGTTDSEWFRLSIGSVAYMGNELNEYLTHFDEVLTNFNKISRLY